MLTTKEQKRVAEELVNSNTSIGRGTTLEGNIETFSNVRIDGKVIGNIKSKSKVALGNASHVDGNITAQNADIEGEVKGKLEIGELLVLKSTATVHGDILTGKLVVEPGAVFNGSCRMGAAIKDIKIADGGSRTLRPEEAKAL